MNPIGLEVQLYVLLDAEVPPMFIEFPIQMAVFPAIDMIGNGLTVTLIVSKF